MKKLLTLTTAVILLLSSSLCFAIPSNQKAMASMLFCYGAYSNLGYTAKANNTMASIIRLSEHMSERDIDNAKVEAISMINLTRAKGVTTQEAANMCDGGDKL